MRIRFGVELFENGELRLLKETLNKTLNQSEAIDITFISGYMINDHRYREKTNIGKYIKIKKWYEAIVYHEEIDANVIFASIQHVRFEKVYQYIKSVVKRVISAYILFYNEAILSMLIMMCLI